MTAARLLLVAWLAAGPVRADIVATRSLIHTGEIVRVEADGVTLKLPGLGQIKLPHGEIVSVQIPKPATLEAAVASVKTGAFNEAVRVLKPLVDRYAGLPVPWVQEAMLRLGEAYVGLNDFAGAKGAFDAFARLYPDSPQAAGLAVKYARVLLEQKQPGRAAESLRSFIFPLLAQDALPQEQESALAEALVLLGDCQRALNAAEQALDNYLLVVTLFDADPERTAEARYKAARVFEELGNRRRARDLYEELLKETPSVAWAAEARNRLDALGKAHPE